MRGAKGKVGKHGVGARAHKRAESAAHPARHLAGDGDFVVVGVADGALVFVGVIKDDADGRLCDAGLAIFVDKFLQRLGADLGTREQCAQRGPTLRSESRAKGGGAAETDPWRALGCSSSRAARPPDRGMPDQHTRRHTASPKQKGRAAVLPARGW